MEQEKTNLELHRTGGVIQAVKHVQRYADALSDGAITNLESASIPITSAERKTTAEEASPTITSPPNLRSHTHTPPLSYDEESADVADASTEASPVIFFSSNDRYESDGVITLEGDNNPFIAQTVEDSTKYKIVLSWSHAIDKVVINNFSENDWVTQNGHNISTDFRNFQLKSIEKLKTNPTLSYAKEISLILCLSSIMYCNEFKPEYLECSEKTWSEVRPRSLTPKELPTVADLVIIEYSRLLSDNNYSIQNGATTGQKGIHY
ncbi:hypothetical protein GLOIN_2v1480000 [Rhizophagus irregularis DAOM 181602=DAOM 197198]|uniref:Uncharacterized protein n=2 Tax=Rhizophagus irregularis (strain DAOM 181602 / DAOM 197198 / MUCL 43194) TaxID=747089 RepID=A0A2P4PVL8_RHIID|nr:hypothetical protein GLOIN_2v1480000 [Rhizophagus irregularis DAOM 181602=DAOM 197198]POG69435.1 hypothetical protein GLOIN_2v1480000 [Rhizophagus irregularis DAOM 181602=DAOM 197198]|eukprot:XP_025176301.1 hypothetical protein GLOIN_2v1480000 [Rhizophagus irregularis DAOM 181602=DAOM 197198]